MQNMRMRSRLASPLCAAVLDSLARWGHALYASPTIAHVNAVLRTPEGWVGVGDPRAGSAAAGR